MRSARCGRSAGTRGRSRPPGHGRDDRHRHCRRVDRGRRSGSESALSSAPSAPASRSPRPGSSVGASSLSGLVDQATTGTVTSIVHLVGTDARHDDPARIRRRACRRPHRRHHRRLACGATRTGVRAAGPRMTAVDTSHESRKGRGDDNGDRTDRTAGLPPEQSVGIPLYELSGLERTFSKGRRGRQSRSRHRPRHQQRGDGFARGTERVRQDARCCSCSAPSTARRAARSASPSADLGGLSDKELTRIRAKDIGFVFQHFNLIPTLTAEENVAIAMFPEPRPLSRATGARERIC